MQALLQDPAGEPGRRCALRIGSPVSFVDYEDQILNPRANRFHERKFLAGNGRIGSNHNQCCINVRDECVRGCRISGEDGAQTRCVYETHAGGQQRAGYEDFRAFHGLDVFGVQFFCHVLLQIGRVNVLPGCVSHGHTRMKLVVESNDRRHHGDRDKTGWNNLATDQGIEEGGFASFELADASYIKASFGDPRRDLTCFLGDWLSPKFLGQLGES
jgi:hypothetical protein